MLYSFPLKSFQMVRRVLIVTKFVLHITNKPVPTVFYIPCYYVYVVNLDIRGTGS